NNDQVGVSVRLMTVGTVNWRSKAWPMMTPVKVSSPGVEAWLLAKEDASVLLTHLRQRGDFREHNSPNMLVRSGQSELLSQKWPYSYTKGVERDRVTGASYQLVSGEVTSGYSLKISPLVTLNGELIDVAIKCRVDQIERMTPLALDVPGPNGGQRVMAEVPQLASWSVHERFQWPVGKVLLVSRGVVGMPGIKDSPELIPGLTKLVKGDAPRVDALLMLECKEGPTQFVREEQEQLRSGRLNYRGRY
ncbi:MAG: hypothetical protein KDB27_06495, partial [Planctomycetales bacterium]|nr:hypothetical protein [Planctomycetales bacterium]